MQLTIKLMSANDYKYSTPSDDPDGSKTTLRHLHDFLVRETFFPDGSFMLVHHGKSLEDKVNNTFTEANIKDGDTIHFIVKVYSNYK